MKTLFIFLTATLLSFSIANAGVEEGCANTEYREELKQLLQSCKPFFDMDLSGDLQIKFRLNDRNEIEIVEINSANIFLESHAYCALQGAKIKGECFGNTQEFTVQVQFSDPKFQ